MNKKEFSVSMCVYEKDNPDFFKVAVESILNQTIKPTEIVLVVDGPVNEKLNKIIQDYEKNSIFNIIRLEKNQGHGEARRIGLSKCKNNLVALMDADDISVSNRFEMQLNIFEKDEKIAVCGGNISEFIDNINNIIGNRLVPEKDELIKQYMKKRCPMNQVTVMFKKDLVEQVGGYIDWYCEEDYFLWLRLYLANQTFYNIQKTLCYVRVGKDMYKRRGGYKYYKSEKKLQKYMLDNGIIKHIRYFINIIERFILQVLMPNKLRSFIFNKFARS